MLCLFINLPDAHARRAALEASFAKHAPPSWRLERLPAIRGLKARGGLSPAEAGCFDSHRAALERVRAERGPVLILEDDAAFGPRTAEGLQETMAALPRGGWDLLHAEVGVGAPEALVSLLQARRKLAAEGRRTLIDLRTLPWFGCNGYVVAPERVAAVVAQLDAHRYAAPYDLLLRSLVAAGRLRSYVVFPFAMTVAADADRSAVQAGSARTEAVWNAARRLLWADRDLASASAAAAALAPEAPADPETAAMTRLLGAMLSPTFRGK